jgi:hypothetical protein
MGRNRKNGSATRFVPAVKAALLCLLLGGSAIGFVYQKNQLAEIGKQIAKREKQFEQLQVNNANLERQLAMMKLPSVLTNRVKQLHLDLVPPAQSQILTIVEVPANSAMKNQPRYAGQPETSSHVASTR